MIPFVPGWRLVPEAGMVELVHPDGRDVALLHYRERMRPLRAVGTLVRDYLVSSPPREPMTERASERLVTREGEHAAHVTLRGPTMQIDLGFVFGDDFFATLTGQCFVAARFDEITALVRRLVREDSHGLGHRRRRFEYTAPLGWEPIVEGFITEWYPPGFPNDAVILTVRPAEPRRAEAPLVMTAMLQGLSGDGYALELVRDPEPIAGGAGLAGSVAGLRIGSGVKHIAVLEDAAYTYVLEIDARSEAALAAHPALLESVVASIVPVPRPADDVPAEPQLFAHWSE